MTCIVAVEHEGNVYVGADSIGVAGWEKASRADQKVFVNGDFIMGFCGSFRLGQLLKYSFEPPAQSSKSEDMEYLVNDFVDSIRALLKEKGSITVDDGVEDMIASSFIVGYRGKIYTIESDLQVAMHTEPYFAVGAGAQLALGSLYSTIDDPDPEKRLITALNAASTFCAAVAPPFVTMCLKSEEEVAENG